MNYKNEKGAITLLVVSTGLFFIIAIVCVQAYLQGKLSAVNKNYEQIKLNYESDLNNVDNIYNTLTAIERVKIEFQNPEVTEVKIKQASDSNEYKNGYTIKESFDVILPSNEIKINTLKFGWMYNDNSQITNDSQLDSKKISDWQYVEIGELKSRTTENGEVEQYYNVLANKAQNKEGYYYLCVIINETKEIWLKNSARIQVTV